MYACTYICIIAAKTFQIFLKHRKVLLYTKERKKDRKKERKTERKTDRKKERKKERKKNKDAFVILSFCILFLMLGVGFFVVFFCFCFFVFCC